MIKCPKCKTTKGITAVSIPGAYDAMTFQFNCLCGVMWKRGWGMRARGSREKMDKEMSNVEEKKTSSPGRSVWRAI